MINFSYKHISKIIDLADNEIDRLKREKERVALAPPNRFMNVLKKDEEEPDLNDDMITSLESQKYDRELEVLEEIRERFMNILSKLSFTFNASGVKDDTNNFGEKK